MRGAALALAARGMTVFPVRAGTKYPLVAWSTEATTDPQTIAEWWARWPAASVAVACGPSGLVVVDLDGPTGMQSWAALVAEHSDVETCSVSTGRDGGGAHLWFRADEGAPVPNSAGRLGPGVDVRGAGGMVLAPPSRHRTGRRYQWTSGAPLALLPQWVRALAMPPRPVRRPAPVLSSTPATRALVGLVQVVLDAPEGTRNDRLFWAASRVAEHVDAGRLDRQAGADALLRAAEAAGLPSAEAARTVQSALHRSGVSA